MPCSSAVILQVRCTFAWLALAAQFPVAKYQKENAISTGPLPSWPLSFGLLPGKTMSLPCALPNSLCDCGVQRVGVVYDGSQFSEFVFQRSLRWGGIDAYQIRTPYQV